MILKNRVPASDFATHSNLNYFKLKVLLLTRSNLMKLPEGVCIKMKTDGSIQDNLYLCTFLPQHLSSFSSPVVSEWMESGGSITVQYKVTFWNLHIHCHSVLKFIQNIHLNWKIHCDVQKFEGFLKEYCVLTMACINWFFKIIVSTCIILIKSNLDKSISQLKKCKFM